MAKLTTFSNPFKRKSKAEQDKENRKDYLLELEQRRFEESRDWRGDHVEEQWFVNYLYYTGNQNLKINKHTGEIIPIKNPLVFYVNQTYTVIRSIRTAVMKTDPNWDVDALPYGMLDTDTSRILGEFLAWEYRHMGIKPKVNKLLLFGLLYGIGILQYGYDDSLDDGSGNSWVSVLDPFDTYIDPFCTGLSDCRYIIKVVSKPYELIKDNPNYDKEAVKELSTTSQMSESAYKEVMMTLDTNTPETKNVILHEMWYVDNKNGRKTIRVMTRSGDQILRDEETEFKKLPFEFYQPDINLNKIYGEGWAKNIVPLNKAMNYLETSRLEYNVLMNKGKLLVPKNANMTTVTNENGQVVTYQGGQKPEVMQIPSLGNDINRQLVNLSQYIQLIGASNEAFIGQYPGGVQSGVALETLISSNFNQLYDVVNNLSICLGHLGEDILEMGYQYQMLSKPFRTDDGEYFAVMSGKKEATDEFLSAIDRTIKTVLFPKNPEVVVKITSGLAHTKEGRRDILSQLRAAHDISRKTVLENLDLDAEREEGRIKEETLEDAKTQAEAQMEVQRMAQEQAMAEASAGGGMPGMEGVGIEEEEIVDQGIPANEVPTTDLVNINSKDNSNLTSS